jgi:hypothetical protein
MQGGHGRHSDISGCYGALLAFLTVVTLSSKIIKPLCACDTSPGSGTCLPPISPTSETVVHLTTGHQMLQVASWAAGRMSGCLGHTILKYQRVRRG